MFKSTDKKSKFDTKKIYDAIIALGSEKGKKAHFTNNGNIKLGKTMGVWSILKGNEGVYVESWNQYVQGTCGDNCKYCTKECYVNKSYNMRPSVILGHARNTLQIRYNLEQCEKDLDKQITRKRVPYKIIRINQSGEIENAEQLQMWCSLAKKHPEVEFYLYTKAFNIVVPKLEKKEVPENLTILFSVWHECGIDEYNKVKDLPNVKAFVYDDRTYNYKDEKDLEINTYCMAYKENGKMDHNITCEKCKKCFNRNTGHKVIGCYSH